MPADVTLLASSTMYVQVPIQATVQGTPYNPTADVVQFAFIASSAAPGSGSWNNAVWQTTVQGTYIAQCLVGPANSGVVLAPGLYTIYVKIIDNPEIPILPSGTLQIS